MSSLLLLIVGFAGFSAVGVWLIGAVGSALGAPRSALQPDAGEPADPWLIEPDAPTVGAHVWAGYVEGHVFRTPAASAGTCQVK
jgi:hypothetical protein